MYLREALLERLAVRADLGRGSQVAEDLLERRRRAASGLGVVPLRVTVACTSARGSPKTSGVNDGIGANATLALPVCTASPIAKRPPACAAPSSEEEGVACVCGV